MEDTKKIISLVRNQESNFNRPVAIMIDLQGQKVRIKSFGKLPFVT